MAVCKQCGANTEKQADYCFRHKKRKPIKKTPTKRVPYKRGTKKKAVKKKPGARRRSVKALKEKLDRVFSVYIRMRDADKAGNVRCFTSGKPLFWLESQCGHFMSRRHNSTRWHEQNCHAQSPYSNLYLSGEQYVYGLRLDQIYGPGTAERIVALSREDFKLTIDWLEERIKHYEAEVIKLKQQKNL